MPEHEARKTVDHDEIRQWAEARDGKPATVQDTGDPDEPAGLLRIKFSNDPALETVDWEEFFEKFEDENLALLYQEKTRDGKPSRFFKLVSRD
ncbi:MAG: hypothetical protein M3Q42_07035 [Pseudomonadota bacterium]|nr:hypothetical protein [Pseudomonadota bacterium]